MVGFVRKYLTSVLVLLILLVFALVVVKYVYDYAEQKLKHQVFVEYQQQNHTQIQSLIRNQQHASMTLAMSLSENPFIEVLLVRPNDALHQKLTGLVEKINKHDGFKDFWVQLIDAKGHSIYRSWTDKTGDDLAAIRPEMAAMLRDPKPKQTISVGRFTISFKSMVPVINDKNQMLGLLEVITQFDPLVERLQEQDGVKSILLTDKRFQPQLTKAITGQFVDGYYVTNSGADPDLLQLLKKTGADQMVSIRDYALMPPYVVTVYPVKNSRGEELAYWLAFTDIARIDFSQAVWVLQKYLVISLSGILLLLLLFVIYVSKSHSDREKRYFRQIIDSVSDIIYIANDRHGVDVNQHFLDFFSDFDSVESLLQKHDCISDAFEEEEGFLNKKMNGLYWLDYVLKHPDKSHKVKIVRNGVPHTFLVKVKRMSGVKGKLYNVLMQDITQVEAYEKELRVLAVTDELTGAGNRLACNQSLEREILRSRRYQKAVSLIMYDIDHFKRINDVYGHDVGDKVLVAVTTAIQGLLRSTDILCRYGGEEFLVILPETGAQEAEQLAQRLKEHIASLTTSDVPAKITISFGVTELTRWDSEQTFLKRVDQALYKAKQNGRNRVEVVTEVIEHNS